MPTTRKSSAIGTPVRCEARLKSTLTPSSSAAGGEQEGGGLGLVRGGIARG